MSGPVFVDTNVFVYQSDASGPEKQARADDRCALLWRLRSGRVSVQALLELYATLTRKLKAGIDPSEAREIVGESLRGDRFRSISASSGEHGHWSSAIPCVGGIP